jgi:hypothetical protein
MECSCSAVLCLRCAAANVRLQAAVQIVRCSDSTTRSADCACATCLQDAVVKGWFRTSRQPTHGGTHLRCVALTAYEVASALAYIHSQGIMHLVRIRAWLVQGPAQCRA